MQEKSHSLFGSRCHFFLRRPAIFPVVGNRIRGKTFMNWRQGCTVTFAMIVFVVALLLVLGVMWMLWTALHGFAAPWGPTLLILLFAARVTLFVLLLFALPQCFLLLWLRATDFWPRLAVGGFSGWFVLFLTFVDSRLESIFEHTTSATAAFGLLTEHILMHPAKLLASFFVAVSPVSLIFFVLLGMVFAGFGWAPIYRLTGDNRRDWDRPTLGGRPPYAR